MVISKYTEDFVRLCVKEHYRTVKNPGYDSWCTTNPERQKIEKTVDEEVIKILFRIEHYNEEGVPAAHAVAEIIDMTIGSNYCKKRPADESLHDLVKNHVCEEDN